MLSKYLKVLLFMYFIESPLIVFSVSRCEMQAQIVEAGKNKGLLVDGARVYSKSGSTSSQRRTK